jgi:hypothetical protein
MQEILNITKLPERTIRYNISILKKQGVIREIVSINDLRKKKFYLEAFL